MSDFERFIEERQYLKNVSPRTVGWYRDCQKVLADTPLTQPALNSLVIRLRQRGLQPTTVNMYTRGINAFLKWSGATVKIPRLKEPKLVMPTYALDDIRSLVKFRPKGWYQHRLHTLIMCLIDTGARINEILTMRWENVDLKNLLVTLDGKGAKQRVIPFSFELRQCLYKWSLLNKHSLVFCTKDGALCSHRNTMRDVVNHCKKLKVKIPARSLHAFRHTFATNYLRKGGSAFHLQRVLGHSDLTMTKRYVSLQTADLQAVHERVSLLSRC